jgi:DNA-binding beta-propeller fold protein YncE
MDPCGSPARNSLMMIGFPGRASWALAATPTALGILALSCGADSDIRHRTRSPPFQATSQAATLPPPASWVQTSAARHTGPQALVTDETQNRLLVVDLPSGRLVRRIAVAPDPEYVAAGRGIIVVVSSRSARVTLLERHSLRVLRVLGGFLSPHIPAISPNGNFAYVTDDARGTLTAISLRSLSVTDAIAVGLGAHHVAFSPDGRQAWIALSESATTIAFVDCTDPARPRLTSQFKPGFASHDLAFSPDGDQVWVSSATGADVVAFSSRDHRLLFRIAVGAGPQHLVFDGRYAFLTSGYGSMIEKVRASNGAVLARAAAPYGSFELDAGHGMVASSSLLRGTLAVYDSKLRPLRVLAIAPAARDLAISAL